MVFYILSHQKHFPFKLNIHKPCAHTFSLEHILMYHEGECFYIISKHTVAVSQSPSSPLQINEVSQHEGIIQVIQA